MYFLKPNGFNTDLLQYMVDLYVSVANTVFKLNGDDIAFQHCQSQIINVVTGAPAVSISDKTSYREIS